MSNFINIKNKFATQDGINEKTKKNKNFNKNQNSFYFEDYSRNKKEK